MDLCLCTPQEQALSTSALLTAEMNMSGVCLIGEPMKFLLKETSVLLHCLTRAFNSCHSSINRHGALLDLLWSSI